MKYLCIALSVLLTCSSVSTFADETTDVDWDAAYEQLLESNPKVREKIDSGGATKEEVIAWLQDNQGANKGTKKGDVKQASASKDLSAFRKKLGELVKSGKLTKADAAKLMRTMAGSKGPSKKALAGQGGKSLGKGKRRGKLGARPGSVNFYAIVIGKLKSKDIELGELELDVEYVISDAAWAKEEIVGKRVKLVGVSGQFLDNLLQIRRGETIKVRTGDYNTDKKELGFGYKFQVLERSPPFKPEDFGVPPQEFRGFRGEVIGKVVEALGYEVLLEVREIKPADDSKAASAESIQGKRIRIAGFYNDHRDAFADLHAGDMIRVGTTHRNPEHDALDVTNVLEKVDK